MELRVWAGTEQELARMLLDFAVAVLLSGA